MATNTIYSRGGAVPSSQEYPDGGAGPFLDQGTEALPEIPSFPPASPQRQFLDQPLNGYLITDLQGMIQEANPAAAQLSGIPHYFLIGKPLYNLIQPNQRTTFCVSLARLQRGERIEGWESALRHRKANRLIPVTITADCIQPITHELPCLRWHLWHGGPPKKPTPLQESNQLLRTIVEASPLAIVAVNGAGEVILWNRAATELFGWSEAEMVGQRPPFIPAEQRLDYQGWFAHILQGGARIQEESLCQRRDGRRVPIYLSIAPLLDDHQTVHGGMAVITDLSARKQAEQALQTAQSRLTDAREGERQRIARELHDSVVQQLIGLGYLVAQLQGMALPPNLLPPLTALRGGLNEATAQLRRAISDLRPPGLDEFGLRISLEGFLTELQQDHPAPPTLHWALQGGKRLPPSLALCLFRSAQELLRNALRHAAATQVYLRLDWDEEAAWLEVEDDGCGFHLPDRLTHFAHEDHFGLLGLQERIHVAQGQLRINSAPGQGTRVEIHLPIPKEHLP